MNQQSFDDIIKNKVGQYAAPVPVDAWDNIMGGKKRRRRVFFWWVFAVLMAGGIAVGGYELLVRNKVADEVLIEGEKSDKHQLLVTDHRQSVIENKVVNEAVIEDDNADSNQLIMTNDHPDLVKNKVVDESVIRENKADNHQSLITNKSSSHDQLLVKDKSDNRQSLITNKSSSHDQLLVKNKADHSQSLIINKSTGHDQLLVKNNNADLHQQPANNTPTQEVFTVDTISNIDIHPITGFYLQTLIDCSISHISLDTNQIKKQKRKSIWTIDLSIAPFIPIQKNEALLYLQRTKITDDHQAIYTASETQTSEELSFAYSIAFRRKINRKLEIGTGVQYSRIREKVWLSGKEINTTFSIIQRLHNDNAGPYLVNDTYQSNTTGTRIINAYNSYSTFSIPVFIQYALLERPYFSLYLNTGTYLNIRKYSNSIDGDFNVAYVSGMKQGRHKMNVGADLFAGLRLLSPGKKYRFFAEPDFRYSFMKNNTSGMINAKYIHQAGISLGISYKFD